MHSYLIYFIDAHVRTVMAKEDAIRHYRKKGFKNQVLKVEHNFWAWKVFGKGHRQGVLPEVQVG